jgi:hypothetical protein
VAELVVALTMKELSAKRRSTQPSPARLDLALLVTEKDGRVLRWIDIEPDDVAQLVDEGRVIGQPEMSDPMRLEPVSAPCAERS